MGKKIFPRTIWKVPEKQGPYQVRMGTLYMKMERMSEVPKRTPSRKNRSSQHALSKKAFERQDRGGFPKVEVLCSFVQKKGGKKKRKRTHHKFMRPQTQLYQYFKKKKRDLRLSEKPIS